MVRSHRRCVERKGLTCGLSRRLTEPLVRLALARAAAIVLNWDSSSSYSAGAFTPGGYPPEQLSAAHPLKRFSERSNDPQCTARAARFRWWALGEPQRFRSN